MIGSVLFGKRSRALLIGCLYGCVRQAIGVDCPAHCLVHIPSPRVILIPALARHEQRLPSANFPSPLQSFNPNITHICLPVWPPPQTPLPLESPCHPFEGISDTRSKLLVVFCHPCIPPFTHMGPNHTHVFPPGQCACRPSFPSPPPPPGPTPLPLTLPSRGGISNSRTSSWLPSASLCSSCVSIWGRFSTA